MGPHSKRMGQIIQRYIWRVILLILSIIIIGYPLVVLSLGKSDWMTLFLKFGPFVGFTIILATLCAPILPAFTDTTLILAIVYYIPWMLGILSVIFAVKFHKAWRHVAYSLLWIDLFCNLFTQMYISLFVDVVLMILVSLSIKKVNVEEQAATSHRIKKKK